MIQVISSALRGFFLYSLHKTGIKKNQLWIDRMIVCNSCPINKSGICSSNFYIAKAAGNSAYVVNEKDYKKKRYLPYSNMEKGCGCIIVFKTQIKEEKCPVNFW